MNLSAILPPQRNRDRQVNVPEILMNCLLAACQHDEFKRLVGWKGMAVCPRGKQGWTMKISPRTGIYGLCMTENVTNTTGHDTTLNLYYFPAPDEPLLDTMSLAANYAAIQEGYIDSIRQFTAHEQWAQPFYIGTLNASLDRKEQALGIQLCANDRKLSIAKDGVASPTGQWVIAPGEAEEDIPAHAIAQDILLVLAAAISNSLGEPPCCFDRTNTPGQKMSYDAQGNKIFIPGEVSTVTDSLGWGERKVFEQLALPSSPKFSTSGSASDRSALPKELATALFWETHDLLSIKQKGDHQYAFDSRPGLIVLSGFLGAGKTTFLNQLLEYHAARDELVAIIQNEIGQTGVDDKLLEGDDSIVKMDEGCVCCTLAGNLAKGIEQLKKQFNPKVIVLETTGLANPFNLLGEVNKLQSLARLDSITTLVDAKNAPALLKESDIAREQIRAADTILLNKCDLISEAEQARLTDEVQAINTRALIVTTSHAEITPGVLYDTNPFIQKATGLLPNLPTHPQHTHTMEGFTSKRFVFHTPLQRNTLLDMLKSLPKEIFRLKGIVHTAENNEPEVVQYVSGRYELSPLGGEFDDEGFLVAIGKNMDLSKLDTLERSHA